MALSRLRTLLVDDVEDMRALLRVLMEQDGRFDIVGEASDGEQAIDLVRTEQPDLVILDLAMPVMDGLTALPGIREVATDIRVVVLSGFPAQEMSEAAVAAGAVGYLEKGRNVRSLARDIWDLATVLGAVNAVLSRSLPAEAMSAGVAREAVTSALIAEVNDSALDTLVLLTSELVTNAVAHAQSDCHLAVELFPDAVRVSVSDNDPTPVEPKAAEEHDESGRGLALVETLSARWGVDPHSRGKTIWFEVPRSTV